jgi:hypothetical protein
VIILQANKFFHEKGGSERYMFALSRALAGRGHEIVDFAMHDPRNLPSPYSRHFVSHRDYDAGAVRALRSAPGFIRSGKRRAAWASFSMKFIPTSRTCTTSITS